MLKFPIKNNLELPNFPGLERVQKVLNNFRLETYGENYLKKFFESQQLTIDSIHTVANLVRPGMNEKEAADFLDNELKRRGVKHFLHQSFAWFGVRSSFCNMKTYEDTLPREDVILKENESFILDTAPYVDGIPSDVGLGFCHGENQVFVDLNNHLEIIKEEIVSIFKVEKDASIIYEKIDKMITAYGYENIHQKYPFGVLAHRLHPSLLSRLPSFLKPFSWQAYLDILSRGFLEETLRGKKINSTEGIWAIEPHVGLNGVGTKFEKILVVQNNEVYWLEEKFS